VTKIRILLFIVWYNGNRYYAAKEIPTQKEILEDAAGFRNGGSVGLIWSLFFASSSS
jgi:hypothetical protein